MSDIAISCLSKKFGDKTVFKDLNMRFPENKRSFVMGESGCGKTTLFRILIGFETADSGTVTGLEGKKLSAVFQENRLCESLGAMQNVLIVLDRNKKEKKQAVNTVREMFLQVGFTDGDLTKPVSKLSGGMKRRVAIIRALAAKSDVVLMDEPFKELDDETKGKVISLIDRTILEKTLIVITHDPRDAELLCGSICSF